ncbi:MAG: M20 family metallopeptidase [Longimicrobiales bacterium]|nr:M20 family metallopeptidase [Longimicrobiales bacterium]
MRVGSGETGLPVDPRGLLQWVRGHREAMMAFLRALVEAESPTDVPSSQAAVQILLTEALEDLGFRVTRHPGRTTGGYVLARPRPRVRGRPFQLLMGHTDTVWPLGTLADMPVRMEDGRLHGPGSFDMKAGVTLMIFALRALRELSAEPAATPVLLLNSDEEIGSPDSGRTVRRLARRACRAFVPEPAFGPEGHLKTARKGVGSYTVHIQGRAAHAGLDPGGGASAIQELALVVRKLHALTDPERGTTVNVGVVEGGSRPNVVAARARADVDVRVVTVEDAKRVEAAILGIEPETPGVTLRVEVGHAIPPLERTPRNRRLWTQALQAAESLGIPLGETMVGGASDGSVISQYTATLDGMGAVGDGAHAAHEHVLVDATVDRCALLALLLTAPVHPSTAEKG